MRNTNETITSKKKNTTPKAKQITKRALQGADTGHLATASYGP